MNPGFQRLGPTSTLSVVWVGHSLMEHKAESSWGQVDLMSLVGKFAESRKLSYAMTDHTLFGSPLSALWRGKPHSFSRDASEMIAKRETLERDAARYDAIVLTEAVPLAGTMRNEFSPYYLRRFSCAVLKANPRARVYLYQTWVHFQGSHRDNANASSGAFDWRAEMKAERVLWDELADAARKPAVAAPHWLSRLGWSSMSDGGCANEDPIYSVPVGNALLALDERLSALTTGNPFQWPDGRPFQMTDMVANPKVISQAGASALRDPAKPMDDIHASFAGIYFSALVHFATLYRQTPVDLPYPSELGEGLAKSLQCVAWETVISDPRAGVSGEAGC
ncbi:hypothetical protein [Hyphomicrobium sp. LHD-15]|uniref:hypothetical protein n=1 Tax=Hyphomicrobium sp. LHD-15 TaxID=3072142 RepID=UPI00280F834E|nr:hypothetical protein [Hyphomicrobium sp. LHD-15]MDQ8699142.1 hypothetical protein [Hyphomicrobium sp. LHD-15]